MVLIFKKVPVIIRFSDFPIPIRFSDSRSSFCRAMKGGKPYFEVEVV